ncbi:unnamed protein product [Wuchereria bancrofti]|uniref:Uncharacterized protein n=2 Tax=Wuchereria bancrofti TaxID=6293 RepID=A0A3P7DCW9_WUCBA|nr:unnamed protein product [Wuchereria bancrofti]
MPSKWSPRRVSEWLVVIVSSLLSVEPCGLRLRITNCPQKEEVNQMPPMMDEKFIDKDEQMSTYERMETGFPPYSYPNNFYHSHMIRKKAVIDVMCNSALPLFPPFCF